MPELFIDKKDVQCKQASPLNHEGSNTQAPPSITLPHKILIGPHHKTGTVWLDSIFRYVCKHFGMTYYSGEQQGLPEDYDIFFQDHSRFNLASLDFPYRGIHIIRDPRDVIISGSFFHQKSDEPWLHQHREDLKGMTYQEKINSFSTLEDKILFEMEYVGKETLDEMLAWNYQNPNFYEIKYESLINDHDLMEFHRIFTFLGFHGSHIPKLLTIAYNNSLFSGRHAKSIHRRSGKAKQWTHIFTIALKKRFLELFGNALITLGYEKDHTWAE